MEYVKLGNTGVTRFAHLPGMHELWRQKMARMGADRRRGARAFRARALRPGSTSSIPPMSTRSGVSEEITGRWLGEMAARDELVIATKVHGRMGRGSEPAAGSAASTSSKPARPRCAGSRPITSTSTRSIAGTSRRRSKKRSKRSISLVRAGKVRYLGASSMAAWQFSKALVHRAANADGIASSRCRTITTWSIARKSAR